MAKSSKQVGRGSVKLPMGVGQYFEVYGGPYMARPKSFVGLKMAEEITAPFDVEIPTPDFNVPTYEQALAGLRRILPFILIGRPVYVGCMGGVGRTGFMLAILAKAWGVPSPIKYVRSQYYAHAVETTPQQRFVENFKIPKDVLRKIRVYRVLKFFRVGPRNMTDSA